MPYATQQNMIDRFGEVELMQLTDRHGIDAIDPTVLTQALADADAEIDGYLVGRYRLPLASVPRILVGVACDVARYYLYEDRVTENVRQRYEDRVKYLSMVAQSKISLGMDEEGEATPASDGPQIDATDRVFSRSTLSDY